MKFGRLKGEFFDQKWLFCHEVLHDFGEFLHLAHENSDFVVFINFCFFNNFLLKNQNKVPLVLGQP